MHLDHTGGRLLVFFSEDSLIVLAFTFYHLTPFDATESTVFAASAKDTNICACKAAWHGNLQNIQNGS